MDDIQRLKFGILILRKGLHGYLKNQLVAPRTFQPVREVCIWADVICLLTYGIGIINSVLGTSFLTNLYFNYAEQCYHICSLINLIFFKKIGLVFQNLSTWIWKIVGNVWHACGAHADVYVYMSICMYVFMYPYISLYILYI